MELKIAANAAVNLEVLRGLHAAEKLGNVPIRELIDLAKVGGFATVLVDQERLINELKSLRQMGQEEHLTAMIKSEIQVISRYPQPAD